MAAIEPPWHAHRFGAPAPDPRAARVVFAVQSRARGVALVCAVPRAALAAALPPGVALAAPVGSPVEAHPLIVVATRHADCRGLVGMHPLGRAPDFDELLFAVPFVHRAGEGTTYVFVPRMYSSSPLTVWHGTRFYGFAKEHGALRWQPPLCVASGPDGRHVVTVGSASAAAMPAGGEPAGFVALCAAMHLPLLGRTASGRFVRSHLAWDEGAVTPAEAWVRVSKACAPLPAGEWQGARDGAWHFADMRWRLSWPMPVG